MKHVSRLISSFLDRGRAVSVVNESFIELESDNAVIEATQAIRLWSSEDGLADDPAIQWVQEYADHVQFEMTVLPNLRLLESVDRLKDRLEKQGLPINPIIGENEDEVARRLIETARAIATFTDTDFPGKGPAKNSFVVRPNSEYAFQDLFWIATKPWIGNSRREKVEIIFDGQKKRSDFSLMNSRFILEMKFAKDEDDKR